MKTFLRFIPFAVVITALSGLIFIVAQQDLRLSANDAIGSLAQDGMVHIGRGDPLITVVPSSYVNPGQSTSSFVVVYDANGTVLDSNLYSALPTPPAGMFEYARTYGEDRVTWQPSADLRIATVLAYEPTTHEFVLAGRSLRETEIRVYGILSLIACGWVAIMCIAFLAVLLSRKSK